MPNQPIYVENPAGIAAMAAGPGMLRAMDECGQFIRVDAEATAPVVSGNYAFGTHTRPGTTGGGFKVDAAVRDGKATVRVSNDASFRGHCYAVDLEFGTRDTPAQHILGNALAALPSHL